MTPSSRRSEPRPTGKGSEPDRLGQLRLLVVLDALLREGSVSGAAAGLGLQSPAVSRMLSQLRDIYRDPLFNRTGKGLVPTPFAESLRPRVRAVAVEMEALMAAAETVPPRTAPAEDWEQEPLFRPMPLTVRRASLLQGEPGPMDVANKLARIGHNAQPQKRLAKYIATTAAGAGRSRPLTQQEAEDAMAIILAGDADPIQLGALLTAIGYRGVTAAEVAGFITAARAQIGTAPATGLHVDMDWPAYISPKVRTAPWFLHAARLVAGDGYRVLLHGSHGGGKEGGKFELAASLAGIPVCSNLAEARGALARHAIAYVPLGAHSPQLQALLALYPLFEIRLPTHAVVHLLNPLGARVSLLGVAQPSSRELHREVARCLGAQNIAILGNTRDLAEFTPFRPTTILRLAGGETQDIHVPSQKMPHKEQRPSAFGSREYWHALWTGAARDPVAESIVTSTAAAALLALDDRKFPTFDHALGHANMLWKNRSSRPDHENMNG